MNSLLAAKMAVCALLIFCGAKPLPVAPSETAAPSAVQASASSHNLDRQQLPLPGPLFALTAQEQAELDRVLDAWEKQSGQIKSFRREFHHWSYDSTFVPPNDPNGPRAVSSGELLYAAPDKWVFRENEITTWQFNLSAKKFEQVRLDCGEHWACDGKSIYCVDHQQREVHATKLPPELRGRPITDGPFAVCLPFFFGRVHVPPAPFAFGVDAAKLKARYFIRISTPPDSPGQVWLDIRPRLQKDVSDFSEVKVILQMPDMLPRAVKVFCTRTDSDVFTFEQRRIVSVSTPTANEKFAPEPVGYKLISEGGTSEPAVDGISSSKQ